MAGKWSYRLCAGIAKGNLFSSNLCASISAIRGVPDKTNWRRAVTRQVLLVQRLAVHCVAYSNACWGVLCKLPSRLRVETLVAVRTRVYTRPERQETSVAEIVSQLVVIFVDRYKAGFS